MIGYTDGSFQPNKKITRAELSVVIAKLKNIATDKSLTFTDTDGHWAYKYISALYENGLISGYPDNTFKPDNNITRAEAVILINKAVDRPRNYENELYFPDVTSDFWAYTDIMVATNDVKIK